MNGVVDGKTDRSNHAKDTCAEGASWRERKEPKDFLTSPLALPRNQNVLSLLPDSGLFGFFWVPFQFSFRHGTSRKSLLLSKKYSIDQERKLDHSSIIRPICLSPSAAHRFANTITSLTLFCETVWLQSHSGPPSFLRQGHSPSSVAHKVGRMYNHPPLLSCCPDQYFGICLFPHDMSSSGRISSTTSQRIRKEEKMKNNQGVKNYTL